jgi:hypothetical protein
MTALPEGFVPHDGGPCPVPLNSKPVIMVRSGEIQTGESFPAWFWAAGDKDWWQHQGNRRNNIIAYRPTQQEPR